MQTQKKLMRKILLFAFIFLNTTHAFSMHKNEDPDYLDQIFSGQGKSSIKQTLQTILPPEIVLLFVDAQLDSIISWNIKNQKRSVILNELASRFNFEWNRVDYRFLITQKPPHKDMRPTPQTFFTMGLSPIDPADIARDGVSNQSIPLQKASNKGAVLLLAKNDAPPFMGIERSKVLSDMNTPKRGIQERQASKVQEDGQAFESTQSDLEFLSFLPASNPSKSERSNPQLKVPPTTKVRFEVTQEDETLSFAFKRWSTQEGYQLVWDADKDFAAIQAVYPLESLEEAIFRVMKDIENSDYPLHACIYKNKVLRIIPMSKVCERQRSLAHE